MTDETGELAATAESLRRLKAELGAAFWTDARVLDLQAALRSLIGRAGAWGEGRLPLHQRARRAARYEHEYARLLWPGGDND